MRNVPCHAAALPSALILLAACGAESQLDCQDLLPSTRASFSDVVALMVTPGTKSCSGCHHTRTPVRGYNFEGPGGTYDALVNRIDRIYVQIASGAMPKDVGEKWNEEDLRVLRSWYCYGAVYERSK